MSNEVTISSLSDQLVAAAVSSYFIETFQGSQSLPQHPALAYAGGINGANSDVIQVVAESLNGYNRMAAFGSETATISNTALTDTNYQLTVAPYGLLRSVGDGARIVQRRGDPLQRLALDMYFSLVETLIYLVANITDGYTAVQGTSGADMTLETLLDAHTTLDEARAPAERLAIMHPHQFGQIRKDALLSIGGAMQWVPASPDMINRMGQGFQGMLGSTALYTSDHVPSSGGNYLGGLIARDAVLWGDGVPPIDPELGDVLIGGRVKIRKYGVPDTILTKTLGSAFLGARMGVDGRGVTLRSTT